MRCAEKQHIYLFEGRVADEYKVGFSDESLVYAVDAVSGVARAVDPYQLNVLPVS